MRRPSEGQKRLVAVLVAALAVVSVLVQTQGTAAAGPYDGSPEYISAWAPRHYYSIMTNGSSTFDVAYYFRFTDGVDAPGSMRSQAFGPYPDTQVATMEIGYKDTGHPHCNDPSGFVQIGIPSASHAQVDWEEDSTDAVLWLSSLNSIRTDQRSNPTKDYFARWRCNATAQFRSNPAGEIGPFQVQLGYSAYAPPDPVYTLSDRTFNMVPQEQAFRGIPPVGDTRAFNLAFDAPWTRDWNFEANRLTNWAPSSSTITNYCCNYDAAQGGGYMYVAPLGSGQSSSWLLQAVYIRGSGAEGGQLELGNNTDYTFDMDARCPTWSPSTAGKSTSYCTIAVWLKTEAQPTFDGTGFSWNIANDGQWHHIESTAWGAQASDDAVQLWIDTRGYYMDVDGVWVSSGI